MWVLVKSVAVEKHLKRDKILTSDLTDLLTAGLALVSHAASVSTMPVCQSRAIQPSMLYPLSRRYSEDGKTSKILNFKYRCSIFWQ